MATVNISLKSEIHAEILVDTEVIPSNYPLIIDPITNSYSEFGLLTYYSLSVEDVVGLTNVALLQNGKNSRLSASGAGSCKLVLTVEDELGNSATNSKIINIG